MKLLEIIKTIFSKIQYLKVSIALFSMRVLILGQLLNVDYWTKYKTLWLDKSSVNLFYTPSEGFVKFALICLVSPVIWYAAEPRKLA